MKKFWIFLIIITAANFSLKSQEIEATVIVNMEQVAFDYRNQVSSLQNDLEQYINNQRFSDIDWEGDKIPVEIQIVVTGGFKNNFGARMIIVSKRVLDGPNPEPDYSVAMRLIDNSWTFEYSTGANLTYNPLRFDKVSSVIDFYMLMLIGFDMDTYEANGGNQAFTKARNIALQGANASASGFETNTQPGVFNKYNLVNELMDMRYDEFRRLIFAYYVNGMDKLGFDREKAVAEIKNILMDMAEYKRNKIISHSVLLQAFFETKGYEIATIFNGDTDDEFFNNLMFLDPTNTIIYTQAREGKFTR